MPALIKYSAGISNSFLSVNCSCGAIVVIDYASRSIHQGMEEILARKIWVFRTAVSRTVQVGKAVLRKMTNSKYDKTFKAGRHISGLQRR